MRGEPEPRSLTSCGLHEVTPNGGVNHTATPTVESKHAIIAKYNLSIQNYHMMADGSDSRDEAEAAIPLIDFHPFLHGNPLDRAQVAAAIDASLSTVGFIYLRNHGIDERKVSDCFNWVSISF
jgi:hypothetical protein